MEDYKSRRPGQPMNSQAVDLRDDVFEDSVSRSRICFARRWFIGVSMHHPIPKLLYLFRVAKETCVNVARKQI